MSLTQRLIVMDWDTFNVIWSKMHMIVCPGEYGLGTEEGSVPGDEKKAWEALAVLLDDLNREMYRALYVKHRR